MRLLLLLILCVYPNHGFSQELLEIRHLFGNINKNYLIFNQKLAAVAWESSTNPGEPELPTKAAEIQKERLQWLDNVCGKLAALHRNQLLNDTQRRQMYLLCRGPKFTFEEARTSSDLYEQLQSEYSDAEICVAPRKESSTSKPKMNESDYESAILDYLSLFNEVQELTDHVSVAAKFSAHDQGLFSNILTYCLKGEDEVQKMMKFSQEEELLEWAWLAWREAVGPHMKMAFEELVDVENRAARRNGYSDIGATWRDDMEIPNLRDLGRTLYEEIRPLYTLLHAVVRFYLRKHYNFPEKGAIPAHLLGDLWSQNWETLAPIITPRVIDLDDSIKASNWSVEHMLKRAEDFYQSLGLPPMTDRFWNQSVPHRDGRTRCHGTAADMFQDGDFRLLYCSGTSAEDMYVIHHEMGHIHYYMAYEHQPAIFRNSNSALHETIGDTIMLGAMTPQHLHRLGLINDSILYSQESSDQGNSSLEDDDDFDLDKISSDDILLLKLALAKIPQIPFALLIEEYRWRYFEGSLNKKQANKEFWRMAKELQGIKPPAGRRRGEEYFDIAAKFHVADNTPYVRYFLSYFLQYQLYEALCKAAVFGRRRVNEDIPTTITLNRCDIYGSKPAGKLLKDIMSRGHSQHWRQILQETIGFDEINATAIKQYYRPLYKLLERIVRKYRVPVGW